MAIKISTDADFEQTIQEHDLVIVKYYADWCGSCKLFAPKYRRLSEEEAYSDVLFLDINAEENEQARKKAGVDNLPFFATFKGGTLLEASTGAKEEFVRAMIEKLKQA